jgi:hypothetical protein
MQDPMETADDGHLVVRSSRNLPVVTAITPIISTTLCNFLETLEKVRGRQTGPYDVMVLRGGVLAYAKGGVEHSRQRTMVYGPFATSIASDRAATIRVGGITVDPDESDEAAATRLKEQFDPVATVCAVGFPTASRDFCIVQLAGEGSCGFNNALRFVLMASRDDAPFKNPSTGHLYNFSLDLIQPIGALEDRNAHRLFLVPVPNSTFHVAMQALADEPSNAVSRLVHATVMSSADADALEYQSLQFRRGASGILITLVKSVLIDTLFPADGFFIRDKDGAAQLRAYKQNDAPEDVLAQYQPSGFCVMVSCLAYPQVNEQVADVVTKAFSSRNIVVQDIIKILHETRYPGDVSSDQATYLFQVPGATAVVDAVEYFAGDHRIKITINASFKVPVYLAPGGHSSLAKFGRCNPTNPDVPTHIRAAYAAGQEIDHFIRNAAVAADRAKRSSAALPRPSKKGYTYFQVVCLFCPFVPCPWLRSTATDLATTCYVHPHTLEGCILPPFSTPLYVSPMCPPYACPALPTYTLSATDKHTATPYLTAHSPAPYCTSTNYAPHPPLPCFCSPSDAPWAGWDCCCYTAADPGLSLAKAHLSPRYWFAGHGTYLKNDGTTTSSYCPCYALLLLSCCSCLLYHCMVYPCDLLAPSLPTSLNHGNPPPLSHTSQHLHLHPHPSKPTLWLLPRPPPRAHCHVFHVP